MALITASQTDLAAFIRMYRLAMIYSITRQLDMKSQQEVFVLMGLDITESDYKEMAAVLKTKYDQYKDIVYKDAPVKDWCLGLNGSIDLDEPLANRWTSYPLAVRSCVGHFMQEGTTKGGSKKLTTHHTKELLGSNPFETFERVMNENKNIDVISNRSVIDKAYYLLLCNAYWYYHCDTDQVEIEQQYKTSDAQWDWLSKSLGELKSKLEVQRYPVLFDERFAPGQSLFWLEKRRYPEAIRGK